MLQFSWNDVLENYIQLLIDWKQYPNPKPPQSFYSKNPGFHKLDTNSILWKWFLSYALKTISYWFGYYFQSIRNSLQIKFETFPNLSKIVLEKWKWYPKSLACFQNRNEFQINFKKWKQFPKSLATVPFFKNLQFWANFEPIWLKISGEVYIRVNEVNICFPMQIVTLCE